MRFAVSYSLHRAFENPHGLRPLIKSRTASQKRCESNLSLVPRRMLTALSNWSPIDPVAEGVRVSANIKAIVSKCFFVIH